MSTNAPEPNLSLGNRIYLYRLLVEQIGCGKQTLAPKIEEALATDRMTADDLGFSSTRALLEELDEFIRLTVFKGGRIYATVIAQPAWDEALAAPEKKPSAGARSGKSWKRKKTNRELKPVRPRRVKHPKPQEEIEPATTEPASAAKAATDRSAVEAAPSTIDAAAQRPAAPSSEEAQRPGTRDAVEETVGSASVAVADGADPGTVVEQEAQASAEDATAEAAEPETAASGNGADRADAAESEAAPEPDAAQPAITLTVVYDPEHANAGITTLESTPGITAAEVGQAIAAEPASARPADAAADRATAGADADETPRVTRRHRAQEGTEHHRRPSVPRSHGTGRPDRSDSHGTAGAARTETPAAPDDDARRTVKKPETGAASAASALVSAHPQNTAPSAPEQPSAAADARPQREAPTGAGADALPARPTNAGAGDAPAADENANHPNGPAPRTTSPEAAPRQAGDAGAPNTPQAPQTAPEPDRTETRVPQAEPEPELPSALPRDFATDVYCPGKLLSELALLLPLGADVMGILTEYLYIAHLRGTLETGRNRASFPLGYTRHGVRHRATVRLRRNPDSRGASWVIDAVEPEED